MQEERQNTGIKGETDTIKKENQIQPFYCIFGSSAIGPLHVINGTPCQDAYAFDIISSEFGVIAVADGLGSASKSEIGARLTVDAAVNKVKEIVINKIIGEIDLENTAKAAVFSARKTLEEKSSELQCKLRDLACTLIVVAMYRDTAAVAHIGDGAVIAKTKDGLKLISGPEDSEYANEVSPLTGKEWEKCLRIIPKTFNILGVMAFTDGCQRAALKKTSEGLIPFDRFCEPLFSYAQEVANVKEGEEDIKKLLLSEKICENSEDDKTLVIGCIK